MPIYDRTFDPPAPVAEVTLRKPDTQKAQSNVLMLIDTGADVTLIPKSIAEKLDLEPVFETQYELLGFAGGINTAYAVKLEMIFLERTFRGQFLLIDEDMGIIGRNVLNGLRLTFDGPRLRWDSSK